MVFLIKYKNIAAIIHPSIGDITQDITIFQNTAQSTILSHVAAIHAQATHQTMEWVVETGVRKYVAMLSHKAHQIKAENIRNTKTLGSAIRSGLIIHFFIVFTTSHQAINAQEVSKIAAIISAQTKVKAFDHTAGHTLFATSLAQMLIAIYAHTQADRMSIKDGLRDNA